MIIIKRFLGERKGPKGQTIRKNGAQRLRSFKKDGLPAEALSAKEPILPNGLLY